MKIFFINSELKVNDNLIIRRDIRFEKSNKKVFVKEKS